jgi:hypothetical protein
MSESPQPGSVQLLFVLIGAALLMVGGMLIVASLLVVPAWVVSLLALVWVGAVVYAGRTWRRNAFSPLAAGVAALGLWILVVAVGDRTLGLWG